MSMHNKISYRFNWRVSPDRVVRLPGAVVIDNFNIYIETIETVIMDGKLKLPMGKNKLVMSNAIEDTFGYDAEIGTFYMTSTPWMVSFLLHRYTYCSTD